MGLFPDVLSKGWSLWKSPVPVPQPDLQACAEKEAEESETFRSSAQKSVEQLGLFTLL